MKKLFIVVITIVITNVCFAQFEEDVSFKSVDTSNFDIAGVKIGMEPNEAISALMKKYNVSKSDLVIETSDTLGEKIAKNFIPDLEQIFSIDLKFAKNDYVRVTFTTDVTTDPPIKVVKDVTYAIENTPSNIEKMFQMAKQKYGNPTANGYSPVWCFFDEKEPFGWESCADPNVNILKFSPHGMSISLSLSTLKYYEAEVRLEQEKKNRTPDF